MTVVGGMLLLFGITLGFFVNTPTMIGPDETFHIDRVIAAAHGDLIQDAGSIHRSEGSGNAESVYIQTWMKRNGPSQADVPVLPRPERPSLNELGGNERLDKSSTNYLTQHPPLYYDVLGAAMWILPGADDMPADQLVLFLRFLNVLLILALPPFFWLGAKELFGRDHPITSAAPFLPGLIAGIPRIGATVSNDNLAFVVGAAIIWLCLRVMRGDTSVRTAVWLSTAVFVGSMTKLTVMALALLVVVAYLTRWIRDRRFPPIRTIGVMAIGAAVSLVWWVRNLMVYGSLVPEAQAWGARWDKTIAVPRRPDQPPDFDRFWTLTLDQLPRRIWGSLGLLEPPQIPDAALLVLCAAAVVTLVVAVIAARGVRWELLAGWLMCLLMITLMVKESLDRYSVYTALTGIQGRYVYPTALGLLLPFAVTAWVLLARGRRWTPVVIAVLATVLSTWALWVSVEYTWLHRGENLTFDKFGRALNTMALHFPLAPPWMHLTIVVGLMAAIAALVLAVRSALGTGHRPASEEAAHPDVSASGRAGDDDTLVLSRTDAGNAVTEATGPLRPPGPNE